MGVSFAYNQQTHRTMRAPSLLWGIAFVAMGMSARAFAPTACGGRVPLGRSSAGAHALRMSNEQKRTETQKPVVVVAGATGRVGRMVVDNLLQPPINSTQQPVRVRALVRDLAKGQALPSSDDLEVVKCDLLSASQIASACEDAAAAVWCATGFSDSQDASLFSKLMGAFKLKFTPQEVRKGEALFSDAGCTHVLTAVRAPAVSGHCCHARYERLFQRSPVSARRARRRHVLVGRRDPTCVA